MKIRINYVPTQYFTIDNIHKWMWRFKRYKYIKGFAFRIFGVDVNIHENNATEKLINIAKNKMQR
jgi:hypothetical protein